MDLDMHGNKSLIENRTIAFPGLMRDSDAPVAAEVERILSNLIALIAPIDHERAGAKMPTKPGKLPVSLLTPRCSLPARRRENSPAAPPIFQSPIPR